CRPAARPVTPTRPETRGKPSAARSTTRGASGMRPLNHGLTVWRAEGGTSIAGGAIRAGVGVGAPPTPLSGAAPALPPPPPTRAAPRAPTPATTPEPASARQEGLDDSRDG